MKFGKKTEAVKEKLKDTDTFSLKDAVSFIKDNSFCNFDETVDIAMVLGIDPRKSDQNVRSSVVLPHGTGKSIRVAVFAQGDKAEEAKAAGADYVGADDLAEKIESGWMDFDSTAATPDMMKVVGKLGKVLGPRGMMPNPKSGTVTQDIGNAVKEMKAGKVEFRAEKGGIVHAPVGKASFDHEKLRENITAFIDKVKSIKPSATKGVYIKKVSLSTTMGPGLKLEKSEI